MKELKNKIIKIIKESSLALICEQSCKKCNGTGLYNWEFDYTAERIIKLLNN